MSGKRKIILRPLKDSDKTVLSELANNKKIWDNVRDLLPFPYTVNDAISFINQTKSENPQMNFAIEYDGNLCGVIGLNAQQDVYKKTAEIGYWIGEPFWGKGIATEAVSLMTEYGLDELGYIRLYTGVFSFNKASMKVLVKNGYQLEGIFKNAIYKNGQVCDEYRYAKTK